MKRVVLDTNVVISGTIAPRGISASILDGWRSGDFELVTCPAILDEIAEKLLLPRIRSKYSLSDEQIAELVANLGQAALLVPGLAVVQPPSPDPDDTMLFSSAIEARADYIVTGDSRLLHHAWSGPARIVSPREFWESELHSGADSEQGI